MRDRIDTDLNLFLSMEEKKEKLYEQAREYREEVNERLKDDFFYGCLMGSDATDNLGDLFEDMPTSLVEALHDLYTSLPMINGLKPTTGLSHQESCAWDVIHALRDCEEVEAYLNQQVEECD